MARLSPSRSFSRLMEAEGETDGALVGYIREGVCVWGRLNSHRGRVSEESA